MKEQFKILKACRENTIAVLDRCDVEELNVVPSGYNNNLIWNASHMIVVQQLLTYKLSKNIPIIESSLIEKYGKGSKSDGMASQEEVTSIKELLYSTRVTLEEDYNNGLFKEYRRYMTSFGYEIPSIEDAIGFNNAHEGLHLGYMMSMIRNIK